jgi:hypothetical protein
MEADLIIGEDVQQAWQLNTIRRLTRSYWQVGDSPHHISTKLEPTPVESFSVHW